HHSPLTTHHSPLTTHHSPLTTHHSPLTTHHSPLTTHHSPLTTHHSPLTTHHSLGFDRRPQRPAGAIVELVVEQEDIIRPELHSAQLPPQIVEGMRPETPSQQTPQVLGAHIHLQGRGDMERK